MKKNLIILEGSCDGVGKTTQLKLLKQRLINEKKEIIDHHFPSYGVYQGEPIERYLKGEFGLQNEISPYFVANLYANDRAITWYSELKKAYENEKIILLDRYTTSSLIYQSALIEDIEEKKKFIDYVSDLEYNKLGIAKPSQVIFLEAPFELTNRIRTLRKDNDGVKSDIHERNLEYLKKVYESALFVAEYLSWDIIKCNIGDELKSIDDIHEEIYQLVKKNI